PLRRGGEEAASPHGSDPPKGGKRPMLLSTRPWCWLTLAALLPALAVPRAAAEDRPPRPPKPLTRQEADHAEAVKLFALALIHERESRLVEATSTLEEALRLDPESVEVRRTLAPLYLALDRTEDVLKTCRDILDREPGDYETWYLQARQLKRLQ